MTNNQDQAVCVFITYLIEISTDFFLLSIPETKIKQEPSTKSENALAWVDKYKPKTIKDIIGQQGPTSNCAK